VFVEKRGVVRVDKVIEISRRASYEPRVGKITLELRDTDRFEASERECRQRRRRQWRNSQRSEDREMIRWRDRRVIDNRVIETRRKQLTRFKV